MFRTAVIALALSIVFVSCSRSSPEKQIESAIKAETGQDADVRISEDGMEIKTQEGDIEISSGDSAKLPGDFPKDVYIGKDDNLVSAAKVPGGMSVTLRSKESVASVFSSYKSGIAGNGWGVTASMDMGSGKMAVFGKDERVLSLSVDSAEGETLVNMTVSGR